METKQPKKLKKSVYMQKSMLILLMTCNNRPIPYLSVSALVYP